jgi:hypothetical protein
VARFQTVLEAGERRVKLFIDHPVGPRARNRKDDVQLVQFLLNFSNSTPVGYFFRALSAPLAVDGNCGTETLAAILAYQKRVNQQHGFRLMADDGTVHASQRPMITDPIGIATIWTLNQDFWFGLQYQVQEVDVSLHPLLSLVIQPLLAVGIGDAARVAL